MPAAAAVAEAVPTMRRRAARRRTAAGMKHAGERPRGLHFLHVIVND